ncbi:MAG TPA: alpha/beta fold hydrolase, partial [Candidatus Sulfotelmatobacter sp.]|nr:alpha/beta fold hydrolase [Candidatus Sulfotelmatobacter sp.]
MSSIHEFNDLSAEPAVRGFLHEPAGPVADALVLTHGAGANCQSRLLTAVAAAFADAAFLVLRCDLPFRQTRPHGPPFPAMASRDREGLRRAVDMIRKRTSGRIFLGGHSYGGRQATMLAAEHPGLVAGLLLLSYPLHPPRKPSELRTAHFPQLNTPALFVHGGRDPFGSHEEMQSALKLLPARNLLLEIEGDGHELSGKKANDDLPARIVKAFQEFFPAP